MYGRILRWREKKNTRRIADPAFNFDDQNQKFISSNFGNCDTPNGDQGVVYTQTVNVSAASFVKERKYPQNTSHPEVCISKHYKNQLCFKPFLPQTFWHVNESTRVTGKHTFTCACCWNFASETFKTDDIQKQFKLKSLTLGVKTKESRSVNLRLSAKWSPESIELSFEMPVDV